MLKKKLNFTDNQHWKKQYKRRRCKSYFSNFRRG